MARRLPKLQAIVKIISTLRTMDYMFPDTKQLVGIPKKLIIYGVR